MVRDFGNDVMFAPLYIIKFRLIAPRKLLEARKFNMQYKNYKDIENIPERLRWCRHQNGFLQKEVADKIGISRKAYTSMENGKIIHYERQIVDKLSELYQIPVKDLLDEYSYFLYCGQGKVLREYREKHGLDVQEMADKVGVKPHHIRLWEDEEIEISKKVWERRFRENLK